MCQHNERYIPPGHFTAGTVNRAGSALEVLEWQGRKMGRTARLKARVAEHKRNHPEIPVLTEKDLKRWDRDTASEIEL